MSDSKLLSATDSVIPDKLYFKIGEVARIVGVKEYVLRYWETEFPDVAPPKSRGKQRLYRKKDIERLIQIKTLLYNNKFTIEGARRWFENKNFTVSVVPPAQVAAMPDVTPLSDTSTGTDIRRDFLVTIKSRIESLLEIVPAKR